jgi:hypothetical protein
MSSIQLALDCMKNKSNKNVDLSNLCARRVSGIAFIRYAQKRKIGKPKK